MRIARKVSWALVVALPMSYAPMASAEGMALSWHDCISGGGTTNRNFACNSNIGKHDLYASIDPPPNITLAIGYYLVILLTSGSATLPSWWEFSNDGSCRQASLVASTDFSTGPSGGTGCVDPWQGAQTASVVAYTTNFGGEPNRVRLLVSVSVPEHLAAPMERFVEYYAAKIRITNERTVGTDSCAGCLVPVCIVLDEGRIAQGAGLGDYRICEAIPGGATYVTWQGGQIGGAGCPGVEFQQCTTPTLNRTWGRVKSLYR